MPILERSRYGHDFHNYNKHIHSRNQTTHPQSESTLKNRSSHPNSPTHSQFTFALSPHSQLSLFHSFRERRKKRLLQHNTRHQTKENGKQSDPTEIVLWNKPNQVPTNHSTIISKHFL